MAIKVKHDGNVTSRIYASAAGGKGKRQAEDAIRLAQLQASAAGRGGGTGGGAHTSATAPTAHAPTSHAQLGSTGSFVSPQMSPETRMRLADDELTNKLIEMDNADAYRAAAQERQGDIDLSNSLERMNRGAEIDAERELTAQGRRERAALVEDVVNSIKAGKFSREELPALMEQFSGAEDMIKMADALREREPTAQEQLDKRRVVLDGIPGIYDSKGNFVPSSSFRDTSEQKQMDYDLRREELAAKRLDSQRTNANKMITDLMKPVKTGKDNMGNDTFRAMSYEEALEIAKKAYPDVYNPPAASQEAPAGSGAADPVIAARTDAPAPTTEATTEPTSTEDDDEFAKFRRK